jgi:VWFA-related protein
MSTRIVVLDVVVTDAHGQPGPSTLTRDDFEVFEDGQTQKIRGFEQPAEHRMPGVGQAVVNSAADLKKIGDAPVTVIVLDELNTRFEDMTFAREMAVKYLRSQPPVLPHPVQLLVATNTSFQQLHDWTQNRDELIQTVQKHTPEYSWKLAKSGKTGEGAAERMAQVLAALQQIAEASTGTPGRKNIIWVGSGFPSSNPIGLPVEEADRIEAAVRRVTSRLLAARITIYSIDPTANSSATLDVSSPDDFNSALDTQGGDPFGGPIAFSNLALSTGGTAFVGRNDINNMIGQSMERASDYYSLSYSPANQSEDSAKFRNIRIRVKVPGLTATTRDGYYPDANADLNPPQDSSMSVAQVRRNLQLDFSNALNSTISYNGLDITAERGQGISWSIHVHGNAVACNPGSGDGALQAEATVLAGWYDSKGKLIGHVAREEVAACSSAETIDFNLSVPFPAEARRLRFVVRDAYNGHIGTADVKLF